MKAVDTNVIVRLLVGDAPQQTEAVRIRLNQAADDRAPLFVPLLVVLEAIWVLQSVYEVPRDEILTALQRLLLVPALTFEALPALQSSLVSARDNRLDLPDVLIGQAALHAGCEAVLTFDRKAARTDAFELLE